MKRKLREKKKKKRGSGREAELFQSDIWMYHREASSTDLQNINILVLKQKEDRVCNTKVLSVL